MKKLILLLLFIPLVSCDDSKKADKEEKAETVEKENSLSELKLKGKVKSVVTSRYKPEEKFGEIERSGILFVANHAFDCIGAKAYGFRSVFIDRRQRPFGESPFQPDLIVKNFDELSDILT